MQQVGDALGVLVERREAGVRHHGGLTRDRDLQHAPLIFAVAFTAEQKGAVRNAKKAADIVGYEYRRCADPPGQANVAIAYGGSMPSRLDLPVIPGVTTTTGLPPCPGLRGEPCRDYQPFANQSAPLTLGTTKKTKCTKHKRKKHKHKRAAEAKKKHKKHKKCKKKRKKHHKKR